MAELEFQRPGHTIELSPLDARARRLVAGDEVTVASNGASARLRVLIARDLPEGSARLADGIAAELHEFVEVSR